MSRKNYSLNFVTMPTKYKSGFSLIELMVALVLSSLIVGGVVSVYLANRATSDTTNKIIDIQQTNQISFQLLSRDIQHAGFVGCNNFRFDRVRNLLKNPTASWWTNWQTGLRPIEQNTEQTALSLPAGITIDTQSDSIVLMYARGTPITVQSHDVANNKIRLIHNNFGLKKNDLVIACDASLSALFQITALSNLAAPAIAIDISHEATGTTPGNSSNLLGIGVNGGNPVAQALSSDGALVYPFESVAWFVGEVTDPITKQKTKNLYRSTKVLVGDVNLAEHEEVISNIESFQLTYLADPSQGFVNGNHPSVSGNNSRNISAVQISLIQRNAANSELTAGLRTLSLVINVRNDRRT